ncbi:MAG: prolipoprotein diacylglyceryl transferase [Chlamydiales bacterium]|nr:prolipoprotein diacylglyceryl transferase [Chlamydiales bacterium]NCF71284.1 prolipoprotein diacylglyceryl transferase [Chlamydiales bacterium]
MNYLSWDIDPIAFYIPLINWPVRWYGIIFVTGLMLSYAIFLKDIRQLFSLRSLSNVKQESLRFLDHLFWYLIIGIVFGARLGHLFFYEESFTFIEIFQTWKGGLASHGGVLGMLIALALFSYRYKKHYPEAAFYSLMDLLVVPVCVTCFFIRIGNFFNQEILGLASDLPWAIIFLHPFDGSSIIPRHPAQLYEAFYYLLHSLIFIYFKTYFSKKGEGFRAGFLLFSFFTFRFFIEFIKEGQSAWIDQDNMLNMGQCLSVPVACCGLFLMWRSFKPKT